MEKTTLLAFGLVVIATIQINAAPSKKYVAKVPAPSPTAPVGPAPVGPAPVVLALGKS